MFEDTISVYECKRMDENEKGPEDQKSPVFCFFSVDPKEHKRSPAVTVMDKVHLIVVKDIMYSNVPTGGTTCTHSVQSSRSDVIHRIYKDNNKQHKPKYTRPGCTDDRRRATETTKSNISFMDRLQQLMRGIPGGMSMGGGNSTESRLRYCGL